MEDQHKHLLHKINYSCHMTVNILIENWVICIYLIKLYNPLTLVSYFDSLQVQDQARFHKESEMTFHKEFGMIGPWNLTKVSKTRSLKNWTPAKSRIPCQIQEGTKVEKGNLKKTVSINLLWKIMQTMHNTFRGSQDSRLSYKWPSPGAIVIA